MTRKTQRVIKVAITLICIGILYIIGFPEELKPNRSGSESDQTTEYSSSATSSQDSQNTPERTGSQDANSQEMAELVDLGNTNLGSVDIPLELPAFEIDDPVLWYNGFTLLYDETYEQAQWVAYELTANEVLNKVADRSDNFRIDPQVSTGSAEKSDYYKSGYDRGHLAPAGDMGWSEESMSDSFYFTNMSPQEPGFNRGIWRELEELVRDWAVESGTLLITTGPILEPGIPSIGENKVAVPEAYYKVIIDYTEPTLRGIGFLMPNEKTDKPIAAFATTIDTIEEVTGIDFFSALPDSLENALEEHYQESLWNY